MCSRGHPVIRGITRAASQEGHTSEHGSSLSGHRDHGSGHDGGHGDADGCREVGQNQP